MAELNTTFQSSWTLAEQLIFDIAAHLKSGRNFWLAGQLDKYYWDFEVIVRILKGMMDKGEKEQVDELEIEILKCLPVNTMERKNKICPLLKKYDEFVMTCLHKHKLDVPQKVDRTRLGV